MTFWEAIARRGSEVSLASDADTFTFPPPPSQWAPVADWRGALNLEIVLKLWSAVAATLADFRLIGAEVKPGTIADDATTDVADDTADTLVIAGHAYRGGDGPVRLDVAPEDELPGGLSEGVNYWIGVVDADEIQLYASFNDWLTGADPIDLTSAGVGTITISDVQGSEDPADDTHRVEWLSIDPYLGFAQDGAITLAPGEGYMKRTFHVPSIVAYALAGTSSAEINASIQLVKAP
jgi:hypothetical protein